MTSRVKLCCQNVDIILTIAGALMFLNEATLLNNVRLRYMRNAIYVRFPAQL